MHTAGLVIGIGAVALVISGCSKSDTTVERSTVTETVTSSSAAAGTTPPAGSPAGTPESAAPVAAGLPQPPAGASQLESRDSRGVLRARYSLEGQSPQQVVDYYIDLWKGEGFTINSTGSGGEPGKYGGSGARATGSKSGTFVAIDAGAGSGEPTYFDVCQGGSEEAVKRCTEGD